MFKPKSYPINIYHIFQLPQCIKREPVMQLESWIF